MSVVSELELGLYFVNGSILLILGGVVATESIIIGMGILICGLLLLGRFLKVCLDEGRI